MKMMSTDWSKHFCLDLRNEELPLLFTDELRLPNYTINSTVEKADKIRLGFKFLVTITNFSYNGIVDTNIG